MNHKFQAKLEEIKTTLPPNAHLLIVSKTRSIQEIKDYYELGHRDFGENRVQELSEKALALKDDCPEIRWHMIGHLQSNKVGQLLKVPNLHFIHSVHDKDLLEKILKAESKIDHPISIFLQYNTSMEEEKSGFENYQDLKDAAKLLLSSHYLRLVGLMTMGTLRTENFTDEAKRCFHQLSEIKNTLSLELSTPLELSMGMSQDYLIALQEGANWIRLGTVMFV
ncbi:MAG: YggS family pyridoxal phosphate-dependent enzyme [Bacteriovoracaceae bacterium]